MADAPVPPQVSLTASAGHGRTLVYNAGCEKAGDVKVTISMTDLKIDPKFGSEAGLGIVGEDRSSVTRFDLDIMNELGPMTAKFYKEEGLKETNNQNFSGEFHINDTVQIEIVWTEYGATFRFNGEEKVQRIRAPKYIWFMASGATVNFDQIKVTCNQDS